ncbi:hypothetical protein TanjilG_32029 [Lupinus angustifolius]|uniref:Uncharacterized protein n=1 Tax=Lupinus angustifolius TaxID=3871 RepID=A0A4P1RF47_LUPAN|nr:PREDICTED: uncharacterized protein LOC109349869 isoform X2 [Lupinus angustifolius]OIW09880.1 hypothetical protein TanjilG_32029 [Lupinus angustifolius]
MAGSGMKRKDVLDKVSDDFSEFSLSSPPTKIRRLDVELCPIPEIEDEMESDEVANEERAIVVFNPLPSPSPFNFIVQSHLLSPINNNWSKQYDSDCDRLIRSEEEEKKKQCLALVPWVSSSSYNSHVDDSISNNTNTEEADEEIGDMDIEIEQQDMDSIANINSSSTSTSTIHPLSMHQGFSGITPEEFHQWQQQQQHCFLPQFSQNTSTPITWTR